MRMCQWLDWLRLSVCPTNILPPMMAVDMIAQTEGKHAQYFHTTFPTPCLYLQLSLAQKSYDTFMVCLSNDMLRSPVCCVNLLDPQCCLAKNANQFSIAWRVFTLHNLTPADILKKVTFLVLADKDHVPQGICSYLYRKAITFFSYAGIAASFKTILETFTWMLNGFKNSVPFWINVPSFWASKNWFILLNLFQHFFFWKMHFHEPKCPSLIYHWTILQRHLFSQSIEAKLTILG